MNHVFSPGNVVRVYPTAAEYAKYTGQQARVVRALSDDERDEEVGPMYEVQFASDARLHVFEDELVEGD